MSVPLSRGGAIETIKLAALRSVHRPIKVGANATLYCRECLKTYPCKTMIIVGNEETHDSSAGARDSEEVLV